MDGTPPAQLAIEKEYTRTVITHPEGVFTLDIAFADLSICQLEMASYAIYIRGGYKEQ